MYVQASILVLVNSILFSCFKMYFGSDNTYQILNACFLISLKSQLRPRPLTPNVCQPMIIIPSEANTSRFEGVWESSPHGSFGDFRYAGNFTLRKYLNLDAELKTKIVHLILPRFMLDLVQLEFSTRLSEILLLRLNI